jgi:hypothetical protein
MSTANSLLGLSYYDDDEDEQQQTENDGNASKPSISISGK